MIMSRRYFLLYSILFIIVVLGFLIRIYKINEIPAGFFCDEAGQSYFAYIIGETRTDPNNNFLSFYVNIFGPIGPVAVYDQIPIISIFGLNEFSSRLTAALIGTLTVLAVFFLTRELLKSDIAGLFASLLTATNPWHIQFSRFGTENIRVPFYFSLSLFFFLLGIKKGEKSYLVLFLIFLFLCFYSYSATNIFIPPFLLGLGLIYRKFFLKRWKFSIILIILFIVFITPFVMHLKNFKNGNRFSEVSVFKNKTFDQALEKMTDTYLQSYSFDFLFIKGDAGMPNHFINRFSVKGFGELYLFTAPFLLIGLFLLIKNIRKRESQIILLWLVLYPVGSVVAGADGGGPFTTRSIIGVLVFQIITVIGIIFILDLFKKKFLKIGFCLLLILITNISVFNYLRVYFLEYPKYSLDFWGWQFGARDIVKYFTENKNKYDELIMAPEFNAPEIFFKFYAPDDCEKCKIGLPSERYNPKLKQLFAISPNYLNQNRLLKFKILKTIYYPTGNYQNNNIAFQIGEIVE